MLDIRDIRKSPEEYKARLGTRGVKPEEIDALIEKDQERRDLLVQAENLKKQRNDVSAEIAEAKRNGEDATDQIAMMREVGIKIKTLDEDLDRIQREEQYIASRLPNLPNPTIPVGPDES